MIALLNGFLVGMLPGELTLKPLDNITQSDDLENED